MNLALFALGSFGQELAAILFLSLRVGAALISAPLFSMVAVPMQLRALLGVALALFVASWIATPAGQHVPELLSMAGALAMVQEVVIGLAFGFVLQIAFAVPLVAAEQIAGTMGLAIATAVDPASGAQSGAVGQFFSLLLILVFLGLGGHLLWLGLVLQSYRVMPPGETMFTSASAREIVDFAGLAFATAAAIALPVVLVLLLVQIVTGMLSRSAPSLNLFALGLPAGVLAGIAALIAVLPILTEQMVALSQLAIEQSGLLLKP